MREDAESALAQFVIRVTSDGLIVSDVDGVIKHVNPAAAMMLLMPVESVIGRAPGEVFAQNQALLNLFTRQGDQTLEVRLPKRRLAIGIATSLPDGRRVVILQDVTETEDLESRRENLIHAIAHDLRNPISALQGFAELVEKFGPLNEQQQRFVTRIRQTTAKVYDVIGSLVDLAWIEAGMPLQHRPIRLENIIRQVVNDLSALASDQKVTIAVSVQEPMPPVMGDPERVQQVVNGLLRNAILYSNPEQAVAIHAWGDSQEVYVSVADRGIGIADDELELVFDRMYRSRDERVRQTPGGGLGLTIARTIVRRHGGDIWAASNLGEGSSFTFVLPVADARSLHQGWT